MERSGLRDQVLQISLLRIQTTLTTSKAVQPPNDEEGDISDYHCRQKKQEPNSFDHFSLVLCAVIGRQKFKMSS